MTTFIKKIIFFLILATAIVTAVVLIPNEVSRRNTSFKIRKDINSVIFGHSHSSYAFNDSIIPKLQNLSDAGESYFYTYQKVRNIIPNNPQIKTVYIEFTNNQIDTKMNTWTWGFKEMSYFLPIYAPFLDRDDYNLLYTKNSKNLTTCLSIATRKNIERALSGDFKITDAITGFVWSDINKLDKEMLESTKKDTINYNHNYKTSLTNINYLKKIVTLCKANNKKVFFVRSPQHEALPTLKNEIHYQKLKVANFKNITLLDFNTLKLPNSYYVDLDHLNYKGAEVFSKMFSELVSNNLLSNPDYKTQIEESILKYNLQ